MDNIFDEFELVDYNKGESTDDLFKDLLKSTEDKGVEVDETPFIGQPKATNAIAVLDTLEEEDEEEEEEEEVIVDTPAPTPIEDEEDDTSTDTSDEDEERNTYFAQFGEALVKLGSFSKLEEGQEWTEEVWLDKQKESAKALAMDEVENFVREKHGEKGAELFEDLFVKGANIADYLKLLQPEVEIENLDLSDNERNQEHVIRTYYTNLEYDEDDIEEVIEGLKATDKLEIKAELLRDKLVKDLQKQRDTQATKAAGIRKTAEDNKKQYQLEVKKGVAKALREGEIMSIPLSNTDSSLEAYMLGEKYQLPNGQTISEFQRDLYELQKDPEMAVALAKLVKDKLDISPVKKKAKSQKLDIEFERAATTKINKTNSKRGTDTLKNLFK